MKITVTGGEAIEKALKQRAASWALLPKHLGASAIKWS
jgi:hypothetical protein